ncbi:MAG: YlcI/YnfO family protein [Piscinibacter sp.]
MKTATLPSVPVDPELLKALDAVLTEGETLAEFVETAVRSAVDRRRVQAEFIARGLRSREEARQTGEYIEADVVLDELQRKLAAARVRLEKSNG